MTGRRVFYSIFFIFVYVILSSNTLQAEIVSTSDGVLISTSKLIQESQGIGVDADQKAIQDMLFRNRIKSVDDYAHWLKEKMSYIEDSQVDTWATPIETLARKSGDCEDLAFLSKASLEGLGYKAKVLGLTKGTMTHAFCLVLVNGRVVVFDNQKVIYTKLASFDQFEDHLRQRQDTKYLLEFTKPERDLKNVRVLYKRS